MIKSIIQKLQGQCLLFSWKSLVESQKSSIFVAFEQANQCKADSREPGSLNKKDHKSVSQDEERLSGMKDTFKVIYSILTESPECSWTTTSAVLQRLPMDFKSQLTFLFGLFRKPSL